MREQSRVDLASVAPGLAWAFEFDGSGVGALLPEDRPVDLIHGRRFVWAHVILANARTRDWIGAQEGLPEEAKAVLLSPDTHPRLDWGGDALWGVLLDVQRDLMAASEDPTDLRFVLRPQFLLTARRHPVRAAHALRARIENGARFEGSAGLFERMLEEAADSLGAAAQSIAEEIDRIEDRVLSEAMSDETGKLLKLRRAISKQDRLVQGALSVLGQLDQHRSQSALEIYRDLGRRVRQRVASFHSDLHLQGDRARLLQEEAASQLASATNKNLFLLTVVTTLLLPPAFVTGYFGMNTKNLPFTESDYGTLYASGLCALAALAVFLLIRRFRMFA
ncbi:zinc transporter [Roseiarcus fermentans]|uniref:Zinc transporter n=1 Tax=Roseiarcus fermentans TaxID=1473586 RepID=A0A366EYA6_9HYPH|nr:CorA family divalent cation transporter [Roseiarcus fermentans]RBP06445.1 zinc transporter [Roseiarcus fermentans]